MEIKRLSVKDCESYQEELIDYIFESVSLCAFETTFTQEDAVCKYKELKKYLKEDKAVSYGAVQGEQLCGFVWAYEHPFRDDGNRLYISILHVGKEERGVGVGKQLLSHLESEARQRGYNAIYLHAEAQNKGALSFYEREQYRVERMQLVKKICEAEIMEKYPGGGYLKLNSEDVLFNQAELAQLLKENVRAHRFMESFTMKDGAGKIKELAQYVSEDKALAYVFKDNDIIAGFTWIYPYNYNHNWRYYIGVIQVAAAYRGRGIAPSLYCKAMKEILLRGVDIIYTHVDAANTASLIMHHKCGFEEEQYQLVKYL